MVRKMMEPKGYSAKYVWCSQDFDSWVKQQKQKMGHAGFKIGDAGVTHKLFNEVIVPNKIELRFPKLEMRGRKK